MRSRGSQILLNGVHCNPIKAALQALGFPTVALQTQKAREHRTYLPTTVRIEAGSTNVEKKKAVGKGGDHRVKWRRD